MIQRQGQFLHPRERELLFCCNSGTKGCPHKEQIFTFALTFTFVFFFLLVIFIYDDNRWSCHHTSSIITKHRVSNTFPHFPFFKPLDVTFITQEVLLIWSGFSQAYYLNDAKESDYRTRAVVDNFFLSLETILAQRRLAAKFWLFQTLRRFFEATIFAFHLLLCDFFAITMLTQIFRSIDLWFHPRVCGFIFPAPRARNRSFVHLLFIALLAQNWSDIYLRSKPSRGWFLNIARRAHVFPFHLRQYVIT